MKQKIIFLLCAGLGFCGVSGQGVQYVDAFRNVHHPEIGYWFVSPSMLQGDRAVKYLDSVADNCPYTLLFLSAREGADFYDYATTHEVFRKIVAEAHRRGLKIGLQLWGAVRNVPLELSERMIVEQEVALDGNGNADYTAKAKFIRFPDRLLKTGLFKVYAFRKTGEGFYDPATLKDITPGCETVMPDKGTVEVKIRGGAAVKGLTACIMIQEYCAQSSNFGPDEVRRFTDAMQVYSDVPFDGYALDEYGNKFVAREVELKGEAFRGRWYSKAMDTAFRRATGMSLVKTLFDARYAPAGRPEVRMKAINVYMDFERRGALRVEEAVYRRSREVWGKKIFSGIHDTYHNSLVNDEIWANGIAWWDVPRAYGQTDEKTSLPVQMGVAMAHPMNAMYNQYYDIVIPHVISKALMDLRYGVRTHYHALNDKRPNRSDLWDREAVEGINKVEHCARMLNQFNPSLPDVRLLVIFGREALSNWYPNEGDRGVYDINSSLGIEEKAKEIWNAGYLNALVPSTLIGEGRLKLGKDGRPVLNGHRYDAVLYLYPQYAKEEEIRWLESYVSRGGKLMIEGPASHDFNGKDITGRFKALYGKAAVQGYSVDKLDRLGLKKNLLPDGCPTEDGAFVFTDEASMEEGKTAAFSLVWGGHSYAGRYKGLIAVRPDASGVGVSRLAAAGLTELTRDGRPLLQFDRPTDVFFERRGNKPVLILADKTGKVRPVVNALMK
ncbi:MAG TPA: hypothetical protein VHC96_19345 [Puia sp.]|nr:hypothetical protein [Puia sp.]